MKDHGGASMGSSQRAFPSGKRGVNALSTKDDSSQRSTRASGNGLNTIWFGLIGITCCMFGLTAFSIHGTSSDHPLHSSHVHRRAIMLREFQGKASIGVEQAAQSVYSAQSTANETKGRVADHQESERQILTVFSTSCSDQQHWESYVLFYHAAKVQQPGTVTRICSGCKPNEMRWIKDFHEKHIAPMNPGKFLLHLTPSFSQLKKDNGKKVSYKYMNKPYGLLHWMENELGMDPDIDPFAVQPPNDANGSSSKSVEHGVVVLMDPDMILLRPLTGDFTDENMIFAPSNRDHIKRVEHGAPIAQQDGYLNSQWMRLNTTYITNGRASNLGGVQFSDGAKNWNTGPPYMATVRDMHRIAMVWADYAPRVHDLYPELFAEMYGFIHATVQLGLPHTLIKSIVVSTTTTNDREGWPYVDALDDSEICQPQPVSGKDLPVGLHYCKRYALDWWFFSKYRLKKKFISCETPLLRMPPADLPAKRLNYAYWPPPHGHRGTYDSPKTMLSEKNGRREAFMLCGLIRAINEAALHFKQSEASGCLGNPNTNTSATYSIHEDPDH